MWAIRSQTRLLYPNSLSYLVGKREKRCRNFKPTNGKACVAVKSMCQANAPWDQFDKVVVEGDASASIKDGGVHVAIKVGGDNLKGGERRSLDALRSIQMSSNVKEKTEKPAWWSVYARTPFIGPSAAAFTTFLMSSYLACGGRGGRGESERNGEQVENQSSNHDPQVSHCKTPSGSVVASDEHRLCKISLVLVLH